MISGNRDEAWPMYLAWPIPERFMLGVIWWHVTCMLSLAGHWQDRRALSNHVCAHSVIPMWHVVCLQHLARASSEQSRSTTPPLFCLSITWSRYRNAYRDLWIMTIGRAVQGDCERVYAGIGPVSLKIFFTEFKFDGNLILLSPKF